MTKKDQDAIVKLIGEMYNQEWVDTQNIKAEWDDFMDFLRIKYKFNINPKSNIGFDSAKYIDFDNNRDILVYVDDGVSQTGRYQGTNFYLEIESHDDGRYDIDEYSNIEELKQAIMTLMNSN